MSGYESFLLRGALDLMLKTWVPKTLHLHRASNLKKMFFNVSPLNDDEFGQFRETIDYF